MKTVSLKCYAINTILNPMSQREIPTGDGQQRSSFTHQGRN